MSTRPAAGRPRRWLAGLAALSTLLVGVGGLAATPAAQAAGSAVLSVSIKPVDYQSGASQTTAQAGTHGDSLAYQISYSCTTAACAGATITISAPQADPYGLAAQATAVPNGMVPPTTLLTYQSWTPPVAGATIAADPDGAEVVSLGDLAAGATGTFQVIYAIPGSDYLRHTSPHITYDAPSPAQFYPDGFPIHMSATMASDTATGPAENDAATVTWHNTVPSPSISESNPGTGSPASVAPDTTVTYTIAMGSGAFTAPSGGNIVGDSAVVAAGSYTVVDHLPAQATFVSASPDGTYDADSHTITWSTGTEADPAYSAAGGWGSTSGANWNKVAGVYTPRTVTVRYPASAFPDADADGCNFSTQVTNSVTASVTYLDADRTTKTADASQSYNVECYTPFARAELVKTADRDSTSGGVDVVNVPPDTTGLTCPASGRDQWGRSCTPGAALAAFSKNGAWYVEADNESNRDGVATITDNDLGLDGAHVTFIARDGGSAAISSIAWTLNDGTTGTSTGGGSITAPAGKWYTAATVTSEPIPAAVTSQTQQSATNPIKKRFIVEFFYYVTSSAPVGTTITNHATASMSYPDTGLEDLTDLASQRSVRFEDMDFTPVFTASQPSAPVVSGGGNPVPGTPVTFTLTGRVQTVNSNGSTTGGLPDGTDITPEYVFLAPQGWTVQPGSASFPDGSVPAGVTFNYRTVTVGGQQRDAVVATWPDTVTFGNDGTTWPAMSVIASPTAAAGNTTRAATLYIGDSRNSFDNTEARYTNPVQNSSDVNGDGLTDQWFASASSTAIFVSGTAGLSVVKQICQPDPDATDGCDWISNPGSVVGVATDAADIRYRITLTNTGSAAITNAVAYDVLPYVGDTGTSRATAATPRGSTFDETLTAVSDVDPAVTLAFSASTNPCRTQVYPDEENTGCVSDWGTTAAGSQAIRATVATLAAGGSVSFEYDAGVASGAPADALGCNSVAVASDQTITAEPEAVCASTEQADLELDVPDRLPLQGGRPGVVVFTVVNHGGSQLSPASVTVEIPHGLTVTDLTPAGYTCADAESDPAPLDGPVTLTCVAQNPDGSTRSLSRDVSETLSIPVNVDNAPDPACVTGSVTGPLPDPDTDNNDAVGCYAIAAAGGLELSKDDGRTAVSVGAQTTYTIRVTNRLVGETVSGATVTDTLPAGERFVSATGGGTASGQTVTWSLADLGPAGAAGPDGDDLTGGEDSTATVSVTVEVLGSAIDTVQNTASVSAADPAVPSGTLTDQDDDTDRVDNVFLDGDAAITTPQNQPVTTALADIVTAQGAPIDPTTVSQDTAPEHGTISIDPANGAVTYQPAPGYAGPDSYAVRVCDTSAPAQCHTAPVTVTVLPDTVTANDDTGTTPAVTAVRTDVRANDQTASGQALDVPTVRTPPAHGSVSVNADGTIDYLPSPGFSGQDSYGYRVCDTSTPTPVCDDADVVITVDNVFTDGRAARGNAGVVTGQNRPITTPLDDIVTTRGAPVDPTTVSQDTAPEHGTISIDPDSGAVTYTPQPGYTGTDSYAVTSCDTTAPTPQCHTTTVAVTVQPNDVVVQDQTISTRLDTAAAPLDVLGSATSASGQPLADPTVTDAPAHGTAAVNADGTITYTPADGYEGADSFTFTVCDTGDPEQVCDTGIVTVTVTPVADLSTTKTLDTTTVVAGLPISYTATISNQGPSAATEVHSIDPIAAVITGAKGTPDPAVPAGSCLTRTTTTDDLARLDPASGPYSVEDYPQVVDCTYPSVPAGTTLHDTITGVVDPAALPGGTIPNQAPVYSTTYDPDLSNNLGSAAATVTAAADVAVTKTAAHPSVTIGDRDTFTVTVVNHGPSVATGVTVQDTPTGLRLVSAAATQGAFTAADGRWSIGTLQVGQQVRLSVVETVTATDAKNTATAHGGVSDPEPGNDAATVTLSVAEPDVSSTSHTTPPTGGTDAPTDPVDPAQPPLASTGTDVRGMLGIAAALLLAGAGALTVVARRRRLT